MNTPVRNIMVFVDGTEESITAAEYAIVLAKTLKAELHALYVVNTRALNDLVKTRIFLESEQEEYQRDLEQDAGRYLNHVRELAHRKGVPVSAEKVSGTVHVEIKNKVTELRVDLLVIGELSQIRSRRDETYNETERAMRSVACPVLIAKDEEKIHELYEELE
jgi:nucleotide-binding universal stress UspA family protein